MASIALKELPNQMRLAQNQMKLFIENNKRINFETFLQIWEENKTSQLHSYLSFRPLIFGSCQTAYSTFLGYCHPQKNNIERKGGVYGLYLTYSTQFSSDPSPILLSTAEFNWLKSISQEDPECNRIFSYLIKHRCFCFVPNTTAIFTKFSNVLPSVMIDEYSILNDAFKRLTKEEAEKISSINEKNNANEEEEIGYEENEGESLEDMQNQYKILMEELS